MSDHHRIARLKEAFRHLSRAQLIVHLHSWDAHTDEHIALRALLEEKQIEREKESEALAEKRHDEEIGLSRKAVFWARQAWVIGFLGVLVAVIFGGLQCATTKTQSESAITRAIPPERTSLPEAKGLATNSGQSLSGAVDGAPADQSSKRPQTLKLAAPTNTAASNSNQPLPAKEQKEPLPAAK